MINRIDVMLEQITDDEILYFLNNIASRLTVPIAGNVVNMNDVITVTRNGDLFKINTEYFCDQLDEEEAE